MLLRRRYKEVARKLEDLTESEKEVYIALAPTFNGDPTELFATTSALAAAGTTQEH